MKTISELRKELKKLEKEEHKLHKQQRDVYNAIEDLKVKKFMSKVSKHLKIGDIRIINTGVTNFHCTPLTLYEILNIYTGTGYMGKPWCRVEARVYTLDYADDDYYSRIFIDKDVNADELIQAEKIHGQEVEEIKAIFLTPNSYEGSKWEK